MSVEECSLYTFTVGGVRRKTTPIDVTARRDIADLKTMLTALEQRVTVLEGRNSQGGN